MLMWDIAGMDATPRGEMPEQLLDTPPADVLDELAQQVADACEPHSDVKAAYVARVRQTLGPDAPSRDRLAIALELAPPPTSPGEPRTPDAVLAVLREFPEAHRHEGVRVLAEAALPVWRTRAACVFQRP
jgi:hypothetical protein